MRTQEELERARDIIGAVMGTAPKDAEDNPTLREQQMAYVVLDWACGNDEFKFAALLDVIEREIKHVVGEIIKPIIKAMKN